MTTSPRALTGANLYHDRKRRRFVVYRRALGITRKTSVRYGGGCEADAELSAYHLAWLLRNCPANKLSSFEFTP